MQRTEAASIWAMAALAALLTSACASAPPAPGGEARAGEELSPEATAIARVLAADDEAGRRRNHACESAPLTEAIEAYLDELEALDYDGCPEEFAAAFRRHRQAWRDSLGLFGRYRQLRGEMHELFERIRAQDAAALEAVEAEIWGTWDEVETAARRHGAIPGPEG